MEVTLGRICSRYCLYQRGTQHSCWCHITPGVQPHAQPDQRIYSHHGASTDPRKWKTVAKHWRRYNECYATANTPDVEIDSVFANHSKEDDIYPLTTTEIAEAQKADATYKDLFKRNAVIDKGLEIKLIENTLCVCKDGRLVVSKPLQRRAVLWYHHNLQHSGHTHLKETMNAAMYWKGMCATIRSITKSCKTCQINKRQNNKYGHLPAKLVTSTPWECLCVDLIGPYTIKGKYSS